MAEERREQVCCIYSSDNNGINAVCYTVPCAGSSLDSRIKMADIKSFSSLFLALLMML